MKHLLRLSSAVLGGIKLGRVLMQGRGIEKRQSYKFTADAFMSYTIPPFINENNQVGQKWAKSVVVLRKHQEGVWHWQLEEKTASVFEELSSRLRRQNKAIGSLHMARMQVQINNWKEIKWWRRCREVEWSPLICSEVFFWKG